MRRELSFRPRGRPKKRAQAWSHVGTRIPPDQHDRMLAAAAREGKSLSAFLRDMICGTNLRSK